MMVMPRSRSRSIESMTRSRTCSFSRKVPDWRSIASTSVVLPRSTWAMIAILRTLFCSVIDTGLSQCFVKHDTDRGRKIQAADFRIGHGNAEAVAPVCAQEFFGQTTCFRPKNQAIVGFERPVGVEPIGLRSEIHEACGGQRLVERFEICMPREVYFRPVVETCSTQRAIVHAKASDTDDVEWNVVRGAESRDVAGVWWNLRFDEGDGKHEDSIGRRVYAKTKRNDELRLKVSSFLL